MSDLHKQAQQLAPHLNAWFPSFAGTRDLGRGTAFPSTDITIAAGDRFFRTDLDFACTYDGTRWLTMHEYECNLNWFGLNALPYAGTGATLVLAPVRADYQLRVSRAALYAFTNGTNNGSNYWTFDLKDSAGNIFWSPNTSAVAAGQYTTGAAINANAASPNIAYFNMTATKTGAPTSVGALHCTVYYRLVIV
jgi:hypothetical protein